MRRWTLLLALAVALPVGVQAQVFKCTDAKTGKVTFTNKSCGNARSEVVMKEPSPQERQRIAEADQRALQRKQLQLDREYLETLQRKNKPSDAPVTVAAAPRNQSHACSEAMKEAAFQSRNNVSTALLEATQWNVELACQPATTPISEANCASARKELLFRANNPTTAGALSALRTNAAMVCGVPLPQKVEVEAAPAVPVGVYPQLPYCPYGRCGPARQVYPYPYSRRPPSMPVQPAMRPWSGTRQPHAGTSFDERPYANQPFR
ncbi:MAG: DUF4124 domain-containing protein [Brachymonas sp.]|nr:DUF4124 domain-containing protein [Brachymonas sp.]